MRVRGFLAAPDTADWFQGGLLCASHRPWNNRDLEQSVLKITMSGADGSLESFLGRNLPLEQAAAGGAEVPRQGFA